MTEKDLHTSAEPEDDKTAVSESSEQAEQETAADSEEKSDFLLQWEKRHEAYLAQQSQESVDSEKKQDSPSEKNEPESSATEPAPIVSQVRRPLHDEWQEQPEIPASQPKKDLIPSSMIWKSLPVFVIAVIVLIVSVYFISPYSTEKTIAVNGYQYSDAASVIDSSKIANRDYVLTTFLNRATHEKNIKNANPWIKDAHISFQFPNRFIINVEEYSLIGYVKQNDSYYAVFSNGEMAEEPTPADQLPQTYTVINLTDKDLIKKMVLQLATVDSSIVSGIQDIQLTPSKVTNDLLTLTMADGNKILVPLSDIEVKLPYYAKIAPQLQVASVVDMEVGIFSYPSE